MRVLIQLRGVNASGKSTAVRQFIERNGLKPTYIQAEGKTTKIEANKQCAVVGWYKPDAVSEGCDAHIDNKEHLKAVLQKLAEKQYRVIVFEGLIYGITYKLATEINSIARFYGYKYRPLYLYCRYTQMLERLMERNGNNTGVNFDTLDTKYERARIAAEKLQEAGICTRFINTTDIKRGEMYRIIQEVCEQANERTNA